MQELGCRTEERPRLNIDTSQASGVGSGITGLVGKLGLVAALATGTKAVIGMGVGLEQTRVQFETFTGSAEKGNAVIAKLQKFANLTPFDDEQVISAGRQLPAFSELVSIYGKN